MGKIQSLLAFMLWIMFLASGDELRHQSISVLYNVTLLKAPMFCFNSPVQKEQDIPHGK